MTTLPRRYYVTTPIYYVNDRPHIGHVYTTTLADVLARYHRLAGDDAFFLTGVDEHAAKVADAAAQRGLTPQAWADENATVFQETFARLGMSNDDFVRTSQDRHKTKVQEYVQALMDSGDVYVGQYEGWYDAGQEEYVTPSKAQASGFKSPINGKELVRKQEKNYFFRLSAYREPLLQLLEKGEAVEGQRFDVLPDARRNEVLTRIREMEDVPISRTGQSGWGIPVPGDPQQTIYVWIDALFNYLTYVDTPQRRSYWQSGVTHLVAKEILWFHGAIWPAMLLALRKRPGYEWVSLPRMLYAHSFWISEGQKMSKSLGNFIDLARIDHYVASFGLDAWRWFLATNGPLGTSDADFAEAKFIEVYNNDLANTLGNCFSRITNMTGRYFDSKLPGLGDASSTSEGYRHAARDCVTRYRQAMDRTQLAEAGAAAMDLVRAIDSYIETTQPFKMAKDPTRMGEVGTILYHCAEAMRIASVLFWPFMPGRVEEMWSRLGMPAYAATLADKGCGDLEAWTRWGQLQPGTPINQGEPLFPRYQSDKK